MVSTGGGRKIRGVVIDITTIKGPTEPSRIEVPFAWVDSAGNPCR